MTDGEAYYADGAGRGLAKKFELQAYDLRAYLKKFENETGEEAISDGFGLLTESDEVRNAYIEYSTTAAAAMKALHEHLDAIADALRKVNKNTEVNDEETAVLFGKGEGGGK
ncbi:hypothetical protein [Streptomyces djakartensis]|uniref:Terminase small subunit n=1 Tax=Streptomyces djakartensis TaxID=68193 RepID=A0ABQ3AFA8_9ACTN|nr:hypothetical protein [Streptomyces djakartensis]GGY48870.1 hypothetical protein GCM10010384_63920 [Streptomyces djakartensis]